MNSLHEGDVLRQLDVLLAPLERLFRYPLPVPAHLVEAVEQANQGEPDKRVRDGAVGHLDNTSTKTGEEGEEGGGSMTEGNRAVAEALLRESARQACETRVEGLRPWESRVKAGMAKGLECRQVLEFVLSSVNSMQEVTRSVQEQSDHLNCNASALMVRTTKLEMVRDELQGTISHFTRVDDLCHEVEDRMLTASSTRFPELLQDLQSEMQFLSENAHFKSAKAYASKIALALRQTFVLLKNEVIQSFDRALDATLASPDYHRALHPTAGVSPRSPHAVKGHSPGGSAVELPSDRLGGSLSITTLPTLPGEGHSIHSGGGPSRAAEEGEPTEIRAMSASATGLDFVDAFAQALAPVNHVFLAKLDEYASLRHMVEMHGNFTFVGAKAFGGERPAESVSNADLTSILEAYRATRVALVVRLLRVWLCAWCGVSASGVPVLLSGSQSQLPEHADALAQAYTLSEVAGRVCSLLEVCLDAEKAVLDAVWVQGNLALNFFPRLVSSIAEEVYHVFRARLLRVHNLDEVAQTIHYVQRIHARRQSGGEGGLPELWVHMVQDAQERLIFLTSVHLRQDIAQYHPTVELARHYLTYEQSSPRKEGEHAEELRVFPELQRTTDLLHLLYPCLEFSVFAEFAVEAIQYRLKHVQELRQLMNAQGDAPEAALRSPLCQLFHLLHLERSLSQFDASMTVVEKSLDFSQLRHRALHIAQSSRDSKRDVELAIRVCTRELTQAMQKNLSDPLAGSSRQPPEKVRQALAEVERRMQQCEHLTTLFLSDEAPRETLMFEVRCRLQSLLDEAHAMLPPQEALPSEGQQA